MKISIVGLGSIARVLATAALEGGHHVEVIGRDEVRATALAAEMGADVTAGTTAEGAPTGDLVILAVPYASAATVVGDYGTKLLGKVVVDITNPFDRTTFTDLVTPRNSSGAEEIAKAAAPGVPIVKAFNSVLGAVLSSRVPGGRRVDVLIAGDDDAAKEAVSSFIDTLGLRPLDTGRLRYAHWLEGAGLLILGQAQRQQNSSVALAVLG